MDDYFLVEYNGTYGGTGRAIVFDYYSHYTIGLVVEARSTLIGMSRTDAESRKLPAFVNREDCVVMSRDELAAYIAMVRAADALRAP